MNPPVPDIFEESQNWVNSHLVLANYALEYFFENAEWPKVTTTRRAFDQRDIKEEVSAAVQKIPHLSCHLDFGLPQEVSLPLHVLFYLKGTGPLLGVIVAIANSAYDIYMSYRDTKEDSPRINIYDNAYVLGRIGPRNKNLLPLAEKLIASCPSIFNGGDPGNPFINETIVRELNGVVTVEDYLRKQVELSNKFSPPRATTTPQPLSTKNNSKKIFVIMPFKEDWSDSTSEMIKEVVRLIDPNLYVYRIDESTESGPITNQIEEALRDASVIIADITGTNPNVMWELGYAHALKKEIVLLNQEISNSPFDVRVLRQVAYSPSPTEQEKNNILEHVRTAIDHNTQRSN